MTFRAVTHSESVMFSTSTIVAVSVVSIGSALLTGFWMKKRHQASMNLMKERLVTIRLEERRGRIRAELRLREAMKQQRYSIIGNDKRRSAAEVDDEQQKDCSDVDLAEMDKDRIVIENGDIMVLQRIGTIVSPFTKRMGTPRQGSLAPHSRGYVQLISQVCPTTCLMGLEQYSHAWIIFEFHANTNTPGNQRQRTKVRPPRAGGIKIGQLATRSPHRPNAIGLSLVKVDGVDTERNLLKISSLDLVNGTPVFDIKPFVPSDTPVDHIFFPSWVTQDDTIGNVSFTAEANTKLNEVVCQGHLAPLYTHENCGFDDARMAICEVLAQDPRPLKRRGTTYAQDPYKIIFCSIQIEFIASNENISVVNVSYVDLKNAETAEGLPLIMSER
jgi:tRNA-Thr(GGU) m(6)t(6)A37 methyltransferase TsaA